jgi:general stress protein 26
MSNLSLSDIAEIIGKIDFAMLSTATADGNIAARPMSNNGEVEYDGDNYFFAFEDAHTVKEIETNPKIGLTFVGAKGLLGKPPLFISIEADAELIRDKSAFEAHWNKDIEHWAKDGIETPGLVLIKAHATRIHYWDGEQDGELTP